MNILLYNNKKFARRMKMYSTNKETNVDLKYLAYQHYSQITNHFDKFVSKLRNIIDYSYNKSVNIH